MCIKLEFFERKVCINSKINFTFFNKFFFRFSTYEIQAKLSQETNSNSKFKESKEELTGWINKLEGVLLGEPVLMNYSKVLTNQLEQLKEMQKSVNDRRDTLEMVNTLGQDILEKLNSEKAAERLTEDLQDLNTRWSDIPVLLDERILKLQKGIYYLAYFTN